MTPSGVEPATFRLVALCLNQLRNRLPPWEPQVLRNWVELSWQLAKRRKMEVCKQHREGSPLGQLPLVNLMFIGPCIIVIVDEWKTNLMSLAILFHFLCAQHVSDINRLMPNDLYMGRTAPLTSKRCILYIYSTNIGTEYFQHALYSQIFLFKMQFVS